MSISVATTEAGLETDSPPIEGLAAYDKAVQELVFGADSPIIQDKRAVTVQAIGGTGAFVKQGTGTMTLTGGISTGGNAFVVGGDGTTAQTGAVGGLGALTKGRTCIGNVITGLKDGKAKAIYIYNICDHEACFAEVGSQAISYTTGVPAMLGAKQILAGNWRKSGVWNMEQHDPDAFMNDLNSHGLPWKCVELSSEQAAALQPDPQSGH